MADSGPSARVTKLRAAFALLAAIGLSTCKVDRLISPPTGGLLAINPLSLRDSAAVGSTDPHVRKLSITNVGQGTLAWTAAKALGSSWLALSANTGSAPDTVTISLFPAGLATGIY